MDCVWSEARARVRIRVILRLAIYRQAVHPGDKDPWDSRPAIIFRLNICVHSPYVTSFLTRGRVCRLQLLLILASAAILRSESHGIHDHILLSQIWDSLNPEGQVSIFISPRNGVAQLYRQALGSISVASYNSQGYVGDIRTRLHTGSEARHSFKKYFKI
jgi:hypothetical protein